ncbi:Uncharacterised protein [uncultured Clostridium sp.]|nr:Uncharacterised protein [uncultured Clostridium sp.]
MNNIIFGIFFAALVIVIILLIINKPFVAQLLIKFRGRTEEVMNKDAMTPEGAADFYNVAIQEKEQNYRKANQLFVEVTGKLDAAEKDLYDVKKQIARLDQNINSAIDAGKDDDAMVFQMKKENLLVKTDTLKNMIGELKESKQHQQEVKDQMAKELDDLKQEKEKTIFELQANDQIIKLHESMNAATSSSETDRMLEKVRAGANKTREMATGSKIAYETSTDTVERRAEQSAREEEARKKIEELKQKRGKA